MRRIVLAGLLLLAPALAALEGKWTPQQMLQLDPAWLKQQGLALPPSRLWDPARGRGLLAATVNVGGCSGGFISRDGLFITNHHCLFGILQEHATPQNDIITNGFLARTREAELRGRTTRLTFPRRFVDVTKDVLAAVPKDATDAQRYRAIERKSNELVAACEQKPGTRCRVAAHDSGVQYVLQEMAEIADVRLVFAPPRAVGEYGGEIDNWMWPRHTGDFAIGRAYVDGQPFHPEFFFPISAKGAAPKDFVMVLGYPGITYRSLTADEMEERTLFFGARADVYGEWLRLIDEATKGDAAGTIALASDVKSLANSQKNAEGQLAGFKRGSILERQRTNDRAVLRAHPEAAVAYDGLAEMAREKTQTLTRDFLLDRLRMTPTSLGANGPKALVFAVAVARSSLERQKPDAERDETFMQRTIGRVRDQLERMQKSFYAPADRAMLASYLRRAAALPQSQHIAALDDLAPHLDELYAQSKLFDVGERLHMFDETPEQLHARHDPLLEAGFALDRELRAMMERRDRWEGTSSRLRPVWRRAVAAQRGRPLDPDANGTLRVSFAHVQGYAPRDGVWYTPQTTLRGVIEKHTGTEPFNVPESVLRAAPKALDLPVDFLADADTTGGNSGSPTVNARGELVGVNFDRVWENVANDFGFNEDVGRNINVDVRYLLWLLRDVQHADELLGELGVR
ncbi:MAG: S46 family peptidase [Acidobacteria bacterium]|nr:S46 family peptidase [Acidobacteriota bacterium]MBV9477607.1 S46 family peptidase [Acidobacteriota bacterium]